MSQHFQDLTRNNHLIQKNVKQFIPNIPILYSSRIFYLNMYSLFLETTGMNEIRKIGVRSGYL